MKSKIPIQ